MRSLSIECAQPVATQLYKLGLSGGAYTHLSAQNIVVGTNTPAYTLLMHTPNHSPVRSSSVQNDLLEGSYTQYTQALYKALLHEFMNKKEY